MSQYLPLSDMLHWPQLHNVAYMRFLQISENLWPSKLFVWSETWPVSLIISQMFHHSSHSLLDTWVFQYLFGSVAPRTGLRPVIQWECPHYSPMCSAWFSWQTGSMWAVHSPRGGINGDYPGSEDDCFRGSPSGCMQNRCREPSSPSWREMVLPWRPVSKQVLINRIGATS